MSEKASHPDTMPEAGAPAASDPEKQVAKPAGFTFPEGGYGWVIVLGSWVILFISFGYVNAFGVYQEIYATDILRDHTQSAISWIGSFQLFLQFALGMVVGKAFDEGFYYHLMFSGSIIYIVSLFMVSLCDKYWQVFLAQGVGMGLGLGLIFLPAVGIVSHYFRARRALAIGIVVSGSSCGGIVFPIMLDHLIRAHGFAKGVRGTAYLVLGCLVFANAVLRPRLPSRKNRPPGLIPDPDFKKIMTDVNYWIFVIGAYFVFWGLFFPFFYLPGFALSKGISSSMAFYSVSILNAASAFGRIIPNFLADYTGPINLLIPCSFMTGVLVLAWLPIHNVGGIVAFSIFFGFFSGAYVSLVPSATASLANHVGEIGVRTGLAFLVVSFAGLTGTPIAGALLGDEAPVWWKPSIFSGISIFVGTALFILARMRIGAAKHTNKV